MVLALLLGLQDPAALVERLGSDDIEVRQRAEADLARLGAAAEPALEQGSRHADREIAGRAARILHDVIAPHRREAQAELAHLLAHLREALGRKRKGDVHALLDALQRLDPGHPLTGHDILSTGRWQEEAAALESARKAVEASTAFSAVPGRAAWFTLRDKTREAIAATPSPGPCAPCARWKLSTVRVGLMFENARVEDILKYLKDVGGLTIVLVDDRHFEHATTISAKDVTLGEALERVLRPYGTSARVTAEGVVVVERKADE